MTTQLDVRDSLICDLKIYLNEALIRGLTLDDLPEMMEIKSFFESIEAARNAGDDVLINFVST